MAAADSKLNGQKAYLKAGFGSAAVKFQKKLASIYSTVRLL